MQNWNQWQLPTGTVAGAMPQPPTAPAYPAPGADPMATMQAYMQYFNQPAPSGYTTEQWAAAQQQNWAQWHQWQQQYQQWQNQYGAKYQETMKQMSSSGITGFPAMPTIQPPPLPKEDTAKPPLPPDHASSYQPHQNNLPLFSTKSTGNPPLPPGQPPPPPGNPPSYDSDIAGTKRSASTVLNSDSAKKSKNEEDELSLAEKKFNGDFKEWEERFNKWKQQNANHPDKVLYKQYEAKWASWREKLIERRELMRKKREAQRAKADAEKKKSPGGANLLNILTNTENQGLINNLLGIGKTLGLSGKEVSSSANTQASNVTSMATNLSMQGSQSSIAGVPVTMTSDMTQQAWAAQQWAAQYNMANMAVPSFTGPNAYQSSSAPTSTMPNQSHGHQNIQEFNGVNFSQPPPGFSGNSQSINSQASVGSGENRDMNAQFRRDENMPFNKKDSFDQSFNDRFQSDRYGPNDRRGPDRDQMNQFRSNYDREGPRINQDDGTEFSGDRFSRDHSRDLAPGGRGPGNDFRPGDLGPRDHLGDRPMDGDRFGRDDGQFRDQGYVNPDSGRRDSFNMNFDRGGPGMNDRRGPDERYGPSNDRFNDNRFGNDRFNSDRSMSNDRFGPERYGYNSNRFDPKDNMDRKNNFNDQNRNFDRTTRFEAPEEISPELKKLMEKRRAALDVFKPSGSFLAPEKSTTNFGSLSESFKKITGDSPFLPRERPGDFGRDRGPPDHARGTQFGSPSGPGGPDNRIRDDFRRGPDMRPRGLGDFDNRIEPINARGPNDFGPRGGNFGPRDPGPDSDFARPRNFGDSMTHPRPPFRDERPCPSQCLDRPPLIEGREKMRESSESQRNVPPMDIPPWMDPQVMQKPMIDDERIPGNVDNAVGQVDKGIHRDPALSEDNNEARESIKKSDSLPFMGENDPKPEDLNMEPPPELPDLGQPGSPFDRSNFFDRPFGSRDVPFKPRGPGSFGPRGPDEDRFQPPGPFGPRGMNNPRGFTPGPLQPPRGPNDGSFSMRGFDEQSQGLRGPGDGSFDFRGPNQTNFGPQGDPEDRFGPRGNALGPRGQDDYGPRGPFPPRGFNDRPFIPQGPDEPFGPPHGPNEQSYGPKMGPDGPRGNIPSLLSFKFDGPGNNLKEGNLEMMRDMNHPQDHSFDRPFMRGEGNRLPYNQMPMEDNRPPPQHERDSYGPNMRPGFSGNDFNSGNSSVTGPRGPGPHPSLCGPGPEDRPFVRPEAPELSRPLRPSSKLIGPEMPVSEANIENDRDPFSRRPDLQPGHRRSGPMRQEFCIGKQFNYNHGGGAPDEVFDEFLPSKVIEYGHVGRLLSQDFPTPNEFFDYAHGKAKPIAPAHQIFPRMEYKYWIESEHNLREYSEGLHAYEDRRNRLKEMERRYEERKWIEMNRKPWEGMSKSWKESSSSFRESKDYKEPKDYRDSRSKREKDRSWDRETRREERASKNDNEDRTRDKSKRTQKDFNSECNRDDERSKGIVSQQEVPSNNPPESSIQDASNQDDSNTEVVAPSKTMELSRMSNCTMVDDILCSPGRQNRPPKIAVILRGPPGSGKSFVAKLIKDKELEQGGSAPRILSLDDYFLIEKEVEGKDDNGKKVINKEMVYEYEEAMESSYVASLVKAFKKNITDGFFNFIILDCINEKIADYEEMWSFAKSKGFRVYVCEMEMDVQICLKRNIHKRTEEEVNRIVDYFEPTPNYHQILDVSCLLQEQAIEEVHMEEAGSGSATIKATDTNDDSQESQEEQSDSVGVSKWEKMEAEDKLDRLDGLAKRKNEGKPQTMEDFLQVPDYYNMEDTTGKKRVRWADLEERKEQEKMRAVGFVVGQTNWNRMLDPTKGGSALTRTKFFNLT